MSATPWTLGAQWIFPIHQVPIEHGTVTVTGDRIEGTYPRGARMPDLDLGQVAILPGLVNAHTHLDLSSIPVPLPCPGAFPDWLQAVIAHRRSLSTPEVLTSIRAGVEESLKHGVTLLADISSQGLSWQVLREAPVRSVVFHELLGLSAPRACQAWASALDWLRACPATPTCRPGLSPHAPYSVRSSLYRAVAHLAAARHLPVTTHLAETRAELELLQTHQGSFSTFLERLGVWDPQGLMRSCAEVVELNREVPRVLLAHGNYLDPTVPLGPGCTVVYCPRTHAHFGHAPHPIREWLQQGVRVALGTDSRASNPDLSILTEARRVARLYPDLTRADILRMATLSGAEALGWEQEVGTLEAGKSADLIVVPLPQTNETNPYRLLFDSNLPVQGVLWRGTQVEGDWGNAPG